MFWLVGVITLLLVFRQSFENRSNTTLGFTGELDLLTVKSTTICCLFLIGRVIIYHYLKSMRKTSKAKAIAWLLPTVIRKVHYQRSSGLYQIIYVLILPFFHQWHRSFRVSVLYCFHRWSCSLKCHVRPKPTWWIKAEDGPVKKDLSGVLTWKQDKTNVVSKQRS